MSYLIPFTPSFGFAFHAFKSANYELPLSKGNMFYSYRIYKTHPDYNEMLAQLPGTHIKQEMRPFLERQKIRKDLIIVETVNLGIASAQGTNLFRNSDAIVALAPGLHAKDKEACHWVLKHEISHIKNNDTFTTPLIGSIFSAAAAVFSTFTMPLYYAALLTNVVGITAFSLFSQWREGKADDFAIENSSNDELLGGRRFLIAIQQMNLSERQTFWKKIEISSNGNNTFDIHHPSLTSRIEKIEKILEEKSIAINSDSESQKIADLEEFLIDAKSDIERAVEKAGGFWGIMKEMYTLQ